ncbi:WhiB family transcriptional regulator [Mycobacterium hodleri]|nr:WhiB family transcriptional regulator [Mycolicibacterium hodleri]
MLEAQPQSPTDEDWYERALCPQTDPDAFFPEKGGSTKEAKKICLGCPVKQQCLQWALDHDERFGIWGGLSERERRRLKRGIDIRPAQDDEPERVAAIAAANGYDQDARLAG